jgi:hypothetical protein
MVLDPVGDMRVGPTRDRRARLHHDLPLLRFVDRASEATREGARKRRSPATGADRLEQAGTVQP